MFLGRHGARSIRVNGLKRRPRPASGGQFSIDRAIGWDGNISRVWWGVGALGAAVVVSFLTLTLGRTRRVGEQEPVAQT